jgi:uncharacterized protein with PIN domain
MKFLCDEMLKGVARWLRAAGYDTAVGADGTNDQELLARAREEGRLLLTRDRRFVEELPDQNGVVLLECNEQQACFEELRTKLGVDWLHKPFSRCLTCNTPLLDATPEQWQEVPDHSRQLASLLLYCPSCEQLFWDGSHVKRMRRVLEQASA